MTLRQHDWSLTLNKHRICNNLWSCDDKHWRMNINDEDIDLGLALGSTYYNAQTRLNRSSGAGVNADSRVDIAFAASDPLSELVWSPHGGLKLKCAYSSLPNTKPIQLWDVGLSIKDHSTLQNIRSKGSGDEEKLIVSHAMLEAEGKLGDKASMLRFSRGSFDRELHASHGLFDGKCKFTMEAEGETADAIQEEDSRHQGKEGPNGLVDIAECSNMNAEQDILADYKVNMEMKWESSGKISRRTHSTPRSRPEFGACSNDIIGSADPINSEPHAARLCEIPFCSLPKVVPQWEVDEVTSSSRDIDMNKIGKPIAIPSPNLTILESSAENDLGNLAAKEGHISVDARENSCPVDKSPTESRICLYQEKGKAKALSDGDIYRTSDEEDGSNDSLESCNSTGLFSKGIKRQNTDPEQLVESKRFKKQIQASHGLTSLVKPDSSFMNWISNMVKGLSDSNKEGSSSLSLTLARSNEICNNTNREGIICNKPQDCEKPKVGFQSMFQSLYGQNAKMAVSGVQQDNCSIDGSGELMVADNTAFENAPHLSCRNNDNHCKQIVLCNNNGNRQASQNIVGKVFSTVFSCAPCASERSLEENKSALFPICDVANFDATPFGSLGKQVSSNVDGTDIDTPLPIRCLPSKSSPLTSLWITRLYSKAAKLNCHQATDEAPVCSTEFSKPSGEFESTHKPSSTELPQTSEAMASVFAKRLDAFRHILHPSEMIKSSTCMQICFFCGKSSHDLRTCPDLTETELNDLLEKISAFDRVGQCPIFCIKCFQFDHWASSCPSMSLQRHGCSQQKACPRCTSYHIELCPLDDYGEEDDQKVCTGLVSASTDSSRKMLLTSSEFRRRTATNSVDDLKNILRFPFFNFSSAQNTVSGGEMFHVITKLRLSRADVLRWMDSNVSVSQLNGFFLRLRLGSSEAGLAGTGYYAARITGDDIESIVCNSKKSIVVDVGGIKSSVGSQYVSNQDFLEDEIKAWWSRIVRTGGSIPSLDELNSKFKERKCLGF